MAFWQAVQAAGRRSATNLVHTERKSESIFPQRNEFASYYKGKIVLEWLNSGVYFKYSLSNLISTELNVFCAIVVAAKVWRY
jgi:hypothetical protein